MAHPSTSPPPHAAGAVRSRRSELAPLQVQDVEDHANGLVLTLPRSKTNQSGGKTELVVLPWAAHHDRCPVTALQQWMSLAGIVQGPVFRGVGKNNRATDRALHPESINALIQAAVSRAGLDATSYSAHSLRAGFVTYAHQTRHRSLATLGTYVRVQQAWTDNAATPLGL